MATAEEKGRKNGGKMETCGWGLERSGLSHPHSSHHNFAMNFPKRSQKNRFLERLQKSWGKSSSCMPCESWGSQCHILPYMKNYFPVEN